MVPVRDLRRLAAAGVPVDLHSYAGAIHAFNAIPTAAISQRFTAGLLAAAYGLMLARQQRCGPTLLA